MCSHPINARDDEMAKHEAFHIINKNKVSDKRVARGELTLQEDGGRVVWLCQDLDDEMENGEWKKKGDEASEWKRVTSRSSGHKGSSA